MTKRVRQDLILFYNETIAPHHLKIGCVLLLLSLTLLFFSHFCGHHYDANVAPANQKQPLLLVLVIGGGNAKAYDFYRYFWARISNRVAVDNIHVYMVWYDVNALGPTLDNRKRAIILPGVNTLIPGCLKSTLEALEYIEDALIPGHNAKYFLRTNLSTFWKLYMLVPYLKRSDMQTMPWLYAGLQYIMPTDVFVPGGYIFLNHKTRRLLVQNQSGLDMTVIDDVSMGRFFKNRNIPITYNLQVCIIENQLQLDQALAKRTCNDLFVFRIKTTDTMDDVHLWLELFNEYYN